MIWLVIGKGFIGNALHKELQARHQTVVLAGREPIDWQNYDVIIDAAWHGSRTRAERENEEMQRASYIEARKRATAAEFLGIRYVTIGSWSECPLFSEDSVLCIDDHIPTTKPESTYGKAKLALCKIVTEFDDSLWLRLSSVVHPDLPEHSVFKRAARGELIKELSQEWNAIPLQQAVDAIITLAESEAYGVMNLGCFESIPTIDMLRAVNPNLNLAHKQEPATSLIMHCHRLANYYSENQPEALLAYLKELGENWRTQ